MYDKNNQRGTIKVGLTIIKGEVKLVDVARICPHGKRSLERWTAAYKAGGEEALDPRSTERKLNQEKLQLESKKG